MGCGSRLPTGRAPAWQAPALDGAEQGRPAAPPRRGCWREKHRAETKTRGRSGSDAGSPPTAAAAVTVGEGEALSGRFDFSPLCTGSLSAQLKDE